MPASRNPEAYPDVVPILRAALAAGGARYTPVPTPSQTPLRACRAWCARANGFRAALRNSPLGAGQFERLRITIDEPDVVIEVIDVNLPSLRTLDGAPLKPGPADLPDADLALDAEFLRELAGEIKDE